VKENELQLRHEELVAARAEMEIEDELFSWINRSNINDIIHEFRTTLR
jgi:hypothetical protein